MVLVIAIGISDRGQVSRFIKVKVTKTLVASSLSPRTYIYTRNTANDTCGMEQKYDDWYKKT